MATKTALHGNRMTKRRPGRPRMNEEERRTEPVSIRLSKDLRARLEKARHGPEGERSLSHEVEMRLKQSFDLDGQIKKRFGSAGTYWLLQLIASGISLIERNCNRGTEDPKRWLEDRFIFDQVATMADFMLSHFRPSGRTRIPKHMRAERFREAYGRDVASYILAGLEFTDQNPKLNDGTHPVIAAAAPGLQRKMTRSAIRDQSTKPIVEEIRLLRNDEKGSRK